MISSKQDHHEANLAKAHENKYSLQDHHSSNARNVTLILVHNHCSLNAAKLVFLNGIKQHTHTHTLSRMMLKDMSSKISNI
jgi:hypothetical protein